jgi:hypothetical protein
MANYLYNGVVLPALPEWDKTVYPYAIIHKRGTETAPEYTFAAFTKRVYPVSSGNVVTRDNSAFGRTYWEYDGESNEWVFAYAYAESDSNYFRAKDVVWTNTDLYSLYYGEEILYLAASEPVPVTETDHNALTQGWIVGKRLAAMRGKA